MNPEDRKEEVQLQGALWGSHGGSGICQDLLSKGSSRRLALLKVGGWCLSPLAEGGPWECSPPLSGFAWTLEKDPRQKRLRVW